jgi:hypothetical protein
VEVLKFLASSFVDHLDFGQLRVEEKGIGEEIFEIGHGLFNHLGGCLIDVLIDELGVVLILNTLPLWFLSVFPQIIQEIKLSPHQLFGQLFVSVFVLSVEDGFKSLVVGVLILL